MVCIVVIDHSQLRTSADGAPSHACFGLDAENTVQADDGLPTTILRHAIIPTNRNTMSTPNILDGTAVTQEYLNSLSNQGLASVMASQLANCPDFNLADVPDTVPELIVYLKAFLVALAAPPPHIASAPLPPSWIPRTLPIDPSTPMPMQRRIQAFELETRKVLLTDCRHGLSVDKRDHTTWSEIANYAKVINEIEPAALEGILKTATVLREEKNELEALKKARELKLMKLLLRGVGVGVGSRAQGAVGNGVVAPVLNRVERSSGAGDLDGMITEMSDFWEEEEEEGEPGREEGSELDDAQDVGEHGML